jgi:hypothetical protein
MPIARCAETIEQKNRAFIRNSPNGDDYFSIFSLERNQQEIFPFSSIPKK